MNKKIRDFLKIRAPEKRVLKLSFSLSEDIETLTRFKTKLMPLYCKKISVLTTDEHYEYRMRPLLEKTSVCLYTEEPAVYDLLENARPNYANSICYVDEINQEEQSALIAFYQFSRPIQWVKDDILVYYAKENFSESHLQQFTFALNKDTQFAILSVSSDGSFRIYHTKSYLQIGLQKSHTEQFILQTEKEIENNRVPALLQVFIGTIRFVDINESSDEQEQKLQSEINQYRFEAAEYEAVWRQYEQEEEQELNARAKAIGAIQYFAREPVDGQTWRFYLKNEEDYRVLDRERQKGEIELTIDQDQRHTWHGHLTHLTSDSTAYIADVCTWQDKGTPPDTGALCLDTYAQSVRARRRQVARETLSGAFAEKRQVVHGLRQVLTDKEWDSNIPRTLKAIPNSILNLFPAGLNESQKEALHMAYNTPDFVVIQGPPGTGKTQVISALCQWLGNDLSNRHKTLLSSFQHEAVDNLALRCRIFDIPVQRLSLSDPQSTTDIFSVWCEELQDRLQKKEAEYNENPIFEVSREVELWFGYLEKSQPSIEKRKHILFNVLALIRDYVPSIVYDEGVALLQKWQTIMHMSDYPKRFFTLLYGIKCDPEAYEDGGWDSLSLFIDYVKSLDERNPVSAKNIEYLEAILQKQESMDPQDFINLEAIRDHLLDQCLNHDVLAREAHINSSLMDTFIAHVRDELASRCANSVNKVDNIFFQYTHALKNDALRFQYACQKYSNAIAATTGQSSGQGMQALMDGASFENVIIDEAARANPMDLLIALTQATQKIILVGDGKQLPHLIEEDKMRKVISKLGESQGEEKVKSALKTTLFERFQTAVKKQFGVDHYLRFIMLDTQYRMRPALGTILSDAFYDGKLKNGKDDSLFANIEPYGNLSVIWHDIGIQMGQEERDPITKSLSRLCEADAAAREAKNILDANPNINLGIITFYSEQVQKLCFSMQKNGIFVDEKGTILAEQYKKRNIKIGTVDAFQGKEFDVVILSTVRATSKALPSEITYETCRKRFGHLLYPGRVCVALSRQKSLLVVFGALSMFSCDIPDSGLVGFRKLIDLCRSKHGKIVQ